MRGRHVAALALVAVAVAPLPQQVASASCAAPYLTGDDPVVLLGDDINVVEGRAFADGCRDTMSCTSTLGCDSCSYDEPPEVPMEDVALRLVQGGRSWVVDVADAGSAEDNRLGHVTWEFRLPAGVQPGRARLRADGAQAATATIE